MNTPPAGGMSALHNQFSVQCPICNTGIAFFRVRRRFNCPECKTTLGSNRPTVDVWAALIYILLLGAVWLVLSLELKITGAVTYLEWTVVTGAIGVAAYCLLVPRLLWLETDSWSLEAPAAPASGKHKVLGYRNSAHTGPSAGAKKRAS
jgi:uncharacterized protein (DUF983 family)